MSQIFGTKKLRPFVKFRNSFHVTPLLTWGEPTYLPSNRSYSFYECGSVTEINDCIDGWQITIKCLSTEDTELYKYCTTPRMKLCNSLLEDKVQGFSRTPLCVQSEARQHNGTLLVDNEQKRADKLLAHHFSSPILNLCHLPPASQTRVKTEFKTIKLK